VANAHLRSVPGRIARTCKLGGALHLLLRGGLREDGWFESHRLRRAVDAELRPLPWYTYACTSFLDERLEPALRVFEFGAGNSTPWYAARVAEVIAVERNAEWAAEVAAAGPATVVHREDARSFVEEIRAHGSFHLVAIDGPERAACARVALGALTADGVLVWDDSEREECRAMVGELARAGFRELPFEGLRPIVPRSSRTSIFYRPGNCLGI
jgi:hypothetical protein